MRRLTLLIVIALATEITASSQSCLPEGIGFTTQAQIDSFHINYPNCTEITGDMNINGDDISDLTGLNVLTSIQGEVVIGALEAANPLLTSCTGLENLIYIGGPLLILSNEALTSCTGLTNLSNIGGGVGIAGNPVLSTLTGFDNLRSVGGIIGIQFNPVLANMTGLDSLISVGDAIYIEDNDNLTSLKGMDNINAGTIAGLTITGNPNLSACEVKSVCNYLVSPAGSIEINNNASGCNSQEEVEEACENTGLSEINNVSGFSFYPNPATEKILINNNNGFKIEGVNIYNQLGQKVLQRDEIQEIVDISSLGQGVYIVELILGELKTRRRLIIKR